MITGCSPSRRRLADAAVKCFRGQTLKDCELVVVNDGPTLFPESPPHGVREMRVPFSQANALGDLRNIGLDQAKGDLVMQWDDDDWHHPQRMETQLKLWRPGVAVLLRRQYRYNLLNGKALVFDSPTGIHGTILHERLPSLRYPSIRKEEDTHFLKQFTSRVVVDAPASLYIRFYHGNNTWDEAHIMGQRTAAPQWFKPVVDVRERRFIQQILMRDYKALFQ